jgi:UDP-N-acetylmuramate dehydrogenase
MEILKDHDITKYNTFGVKVLAKYFTEIKSEADLFSILENEEFKKNKKIILGGGSNVLFTKDFDGFVVVNKLEGFELIKNQSSTSIEVIVRSLSGTNWHSLVRFTVENEYWGLENLSFIPGTVGAAPMQNIGAYGAELKDSLVSVEAVEVATGVRKIFSPAECKLGYRDSIFKNEYKDKYFIYAVSLKLSKVPKINTSYKVLADYLQYNNIKVEKSIDISDAVIAIRKSKLPDPSVLGNAGSFFKNVILDKEKDKEKIKSLFCMYENLPSFEEEGKVKIPTGFLIEQCGWKGKRVGNVGVYEKQSLVLVNHGQASGLDVLNIAKQIILDVKNKFGLDIAPEVNLI